MFSYQSLVIIRYRADQTSQLAWPRANFFRCLIWPFFASLHVCRPKTEGRPNSRVINFLPSLDGKDGDAGILSATVNAETWRRVISLLTRRKFAQFRPRVLRQFRGEDFLRVIRALSDQSVFNGSRSRAQVNAVHRRQFSVNDVGRGLFIGRDVVTAFRDLPVDGHLVPFFTNEDVFASLGVDRYHFIEDSRAAAHSRFGERITRDRAPLRHRTASHHADVLSRVSNYATNHRFQRSVGNSVLYYRPFP